MRTEAQQKARRKYLAKGKRITIDFYPTEADLIEHIEKQPNKQGYIKALIKHAIENKIEVYVRTGSQVAEGLSLDEQKRQLIEYANSHKDK